ncbi:MAG: NAD(+) diphosphatase [Microbacteriaceae bacterium]
MATNWREVQQRLAFHEPVPDHSLDAQGIDQEALFAELWSRPGTLVLPLQGDRVLVDAAGRLALLSPGQLGDGAGADAALRLYLGRVETEEGIPDDGVLVAAAPDAESTGAPVIAVLVDEHEAEQITAGQWKPLRAMSAELDARDVGLATRAVALANWHRSHPFSPTTGHATRVTNGGWVRVDEVSGAELFPRTDPAVIIAVLDDEDRLLLASNMAWDSRVYSLIAGFVDPGESLEQAVQREVFEESGVQVSDPTYLASQPWPFPASLMLGFRARLTGGVDSTRPDGVEIRETKWFTRAELEAEVASGTVILPGKASIARAIIDTWLGEALNTP